MLGADGCPCDPLDEPCLASNESAVSSTLHARHTTGEAPGDSAIPSKPIDPQSDNGQDELAASSTAPDTHSAAADAGAGPPSPGAETAATDPVRQTSGGSASEKLKFLCPQSRILAAGGGHVGYPSSPCGSASMPRSEAHPSAASSGPVGTSSQTATGTDTATGLARQMSARSQASRESVDFGEAESEIWDMNASSEDSNSSDEDHLEELSGHLWKKSPSALKFGKYQWRYFRVKSAKIFWWKSEEDCLRGCRTSNGCLDLRVNFTEIWPDWPVKFALVPQGGEWTSASFTGGKKGRRIYLDTTKSEHSTAEWIRVITQHIRYAHEHPCI